MHSQRTMQKLSALLLAFLLFSVGLEVAVPSGLAQENPATPVTVVLQQDKLVVKSDKVPLGRVLENDLIVEYAGTEIKTAQDLRREVRKKTPDDEVEMIIVRDGEPLRIILKGGFIGVQIKTTRIPKEVLDSYYSEQY